MTEVVYNEQAFLLWKRFIDTGNAAEFTAHLDNKKGKLPFHKIVGSYEPTIVISKALKNKKAETYHNLLNLETYKLNALIPQIKLYKILKNKYIPFYFPNSAEPEDIKRILEVGGSLHGAGIKSFDVSFTGTDMFTRDKIIECSLSLYVENLEVIFKDPPMPGYAKLADLFTISNKKKATVSEGVSKEVPTSLVSRASNYEIVAVVGHTAPKAKDIFTQSEIDAIDSSQLSLRMTMNDHTINVNQDGSATIEISYHGRLSGILKGGPYDTMQTVMNLLEHSARIKAVHEDGAGATAPDSAKKKEEEEIERKTKEASLKVFRDYIDHIDSFDSIRTLPIPDKDWKDFRNYQISTSDSENKEKDNVPVALGDGDTAAAPTAGAEDFSTPGGECSLEVGLRVRSANFILLGELIEAMLQLTKDRIEGPLATIGSGSKGLLKTAKGKERKKLVQRKKYLTECKKQFKSFKVMMANIPIRVGASRVTQVNISDIPISLTLYYTWVFERIVQANRHKFTVMDFMNDVVSFLIPRALAGAATKDAKFLDMGAHVKSMTITGGDLSSYQSKKVEIKVKDLPNFLRRVPARNLRSEKDYYFIYAEPVDTTPSARKGDLVKDIQEGIHHFHLGHDRGMLKSISFNKFDIPGKKESLMVNSVSLYDELRMPYTATLTMFGNNLFLPGSMLYINPSSIGFGDPRNKRSAAVRLGLGGYYTVLNVKTTLTGNELVTTLTTSYVSWADSASSLVSEIADLQKEREEKKKEAADASPAEADTSKPERPEPRPSYNSSVSREPNTGFITRSGLLTEREKAAAIAMFKYGTDSSQFSSADEKTPEVTYRIEPQNAEQYRGPRTKRESPDDFTIRLQRRDQSGRVRTFLIKTTSSGDSTLKAEGDQ